MATDRNKVLQPPLSVDDAVQELDAAGTVLGLAQVAALEFGAVVAAAKRNRLEREAVRLQARYGKDAPRALAAGERRDAQQEFIAALDAERARVAVPVPDARPDTALLYGRVLDERGQPLARIPVVATPAKGAAVQGRSNTQGLYQLAVALKEPALWSVQAGDERRAASEPVTVALRPGTRARRDLVLRPGPEDGEDTLSMPDVLGQTEAQARERLERLGLKNVNARTVDASAALGLVVRQDPAPGGPLDADTAVTLDVAQGDQLPPQTVAVPLLEGLTLEAAQTALKKARLALGQISGEGPNARVVAQKPKAGSAVAPGSAVDLKLQVPG